MANNVARVDEATNAMGGIAVADRAPIAADWIPALRDAGEVSTRTIRPHLPQQASDVASRADCEPAFSALGRITVGRGPIADIAVDSDTGQLFVTNQVDHSVSMLDPGTLTVIGSVTGVEEPSAVTSAAGRAYSSTVMVSYDAITVLDPAASEPVIHPLANTIRDLAASRDGRRVYAARTGRGGADAAVLDTASGRISTIDLGTRRGASAEAIAISPDDTRIYVVTADHAGGEFVAVDTDGHGVAGGLAFDEPLRDVAVSADGASVFVASCHPATGATVDVVDAHSLRVIDTVTLGGEVSQLLVAAAGDRFYAVNGDRIMVLSASTHEVLDSITTVTEPSCIAESPDGSRLFVADYDGTVTALAVTPTTDAMLAKLLASAVIDVPMLELEPAV
jgi:YVTN family beta-propeller protein